MAALRLLTYNLAGLDEVALDERSEAQCLSLLLVPVPWDVLCLQELVRRSWHGHWRHHLHHAGYRVFPADPTTTDSEYFCALAVRDTLRPSEGRAEPFPASRMGRVSLSIAVGDFRVWTSHLESERQGREERIRQLSTVIDAMKAHGGPAVFAGDANLRADEEAEVHGFADVHDAWVSAGRPADARATWFGRKASARYDRVLFTPDVTCRDFVVRQASDAGLRLSDHASIGVTLSDQRVEEQ